MQSEQMAATMTMEVDETGSMGNYDADMSSSNFSSIIDPVNQERQAEASINFSVNSSVAMSWPGFNELPN